MFSNAPVGDLQEEVNAVGVHDCMDAGGRAKQEPEPMDARNDQLDQLSMY